MAAVAVGAVEQGAAVEEEGVEEAAAVLVEVEQVVGVAGHKLAAVCP